MQSSRKPEVTKASGEIGLGVGFYTRAEAARLLGVHATTLNRWVMGYTYRRGEVTPVRRSALIPPSLPERRGLVALSFVDLIELRVVKVLIDRGLSLQRIRKARRYAQQHYPVAHPFASRRVYTADKNVFIDFLSSDGAPDFLELTHRGHLQIQAGGLVEGFLDEVAFDDKRSLAHKWWPLGRAFPVTLDPAVAFGAPVVEGTGVRTDVIAALATRTSVADAADAYRLDSEPARAALRFERILRAA